jgi:plastocyanin
VPGAYRNSAESSLRDRLRPRCRETRLLGREGRIEVELRRITMSRLLRQPGPRPHFEGSARTAALGDGSENGATDMRTGIRLTVAAVMAGLAAGLAVVQPVVAAGSTRVLMVDNEPDLTNWHFEPAEVTVPAGTTVLWHNKGKEEHSVTADDKSFDSGWKPKGGNYQRTFTRPGTYTYHCAPHPWMKGVVGGVADAPPPPSPTASPAPTTTLTTAAPATTTTAAPPPAPSAEHQADAAPTTTAALEATSPAATAMSGYTAAAPAENQRRPRSGRDLAGTVVIVVGPTLCALALGAKLRRKDD